MKIKVGVWNKFFATYQKTVGPEKVEAAKAQLSEADRNELFGKPLLPINWVDYGAMLNLWAALDRIVGKGDFSHMHEMAKNITKANADTFSKLIFMVASPDLIIPKSFQLWRQYYSEGTIQVLIHERGQRIVARLTDAPSLPEYYQHDMVPTFEATMEMLGVKTCSVKHIPCASPGEGICTFDISWGKCVKIPAGVGANSNLEK